MTRDAFQPGDGLRVGCGDKRAPAAAHGRDTPPTGGNAAKFVQVYPPRASSREKIAGHMDRPDRYHTLPVVVISHPDGSTRPAPFLMSLDEVSAFFRLHESKTKFPSKTIQRYRKMGLRSVRISRRLWFRLDDVMRFLDDQQERLSMA